MKRSEAIEKLRNILEDIMNVDYVSLATSKYILDFLEEDIGMFPPYDSTSDDEDPNYNWQSEQELYVGPY